MNSQSTKASRLIARIRHRGKMASKKSRVQEIGFTPVPSRRLQRLVQRKVLDITLSVAGLTPKELQMRGLPENPTAVQELAQKQVVRGLPRAEMVRSYQPKPSRSDDPAYRKPNLVR